MALPQRKTDEPCRATFRIGCVLTAPLDNGEWLPIGTLNDSFICDLVADVNDDKELKVEVAKTIKEFRNKQVNVIGLENIISGTLNQEEKNGNV